MEVIVIEKEAYSRLQRELIRLFQKALKDSSRMKKIQNRTYKLEVATINDGYTFASGGIEFTVTVDINQSWVLSSADSCFRHSFADSLEAWKFISHLKQLDLEGLK